MLLLATARSTSARASVTRFRGLPDVGIHTVRIWPMRPAARHGFDDAASGELRWPDGQPCAMLDPTDAA